MVLKRFSNNLAQPPAVPGRQRILYVEDEDANWDVAEARLKVKYELKRAKNAAEAFAMLAEEDFDLILMDIQLADSQYDGIEITRILRRTFNKPVPAALALEGRPSVPIIFVTAYTARYSKEDLLAFGGDEVIAKPVDFTQLSLAITRLIARKLQAGAK